MNRLNLISRHSLNDASISFIDETPKEQETLLNESASEVQVNGVLATPRLSLPQITLFINETFARYNSDQDREKKLAGQDVSTTSEETDRTGSAAKGSCLTS